MTSIIQELGFAEVIAHNEMSLVHIPKLTIPLRLSGQITLIFVPATSAAPGRFLHIFEGYCTFQCCINISSYKGAMPDVTSS